MRRIKIRISKRDRRLVLSFALFATVLTSAGLYSYYWQPVTGQKFFALWMLGAHHLVGDYYPNNDTSIRPRSILNWTLGVYNHMGNLEYIVIMVKLLNSTNQEPNDLNGVPSPVAPIFQIHRVLTDNETWSTPFTWSILNAIVL